MPFETKMPFKTKLRFRPKTLFKTKMLFKKNAQPKSGIKLGNNVQAHRTAAIVLIFWMLFALIGPLFAPWGFHESENIITEFVDGRNIYHFSPHPPSSRHPLGTDDYGYDFLTSLLFGARYSVFFTLIAALLRTLLGFLIGSYQALRHVGLRQPARSGNILKTSRKFSFLSGLPVFVLLYFIQYSFFINPEISPPAMAAVQGFLIVLFGIPASAPLFKGRTAVLLEEPFIEAAFSCGGSRRRIFRHHIVPHLLEDIYLSVAQEIVAILTILGQLGLFSIFIGGTRFTRDPPELHSITREWGGLVGHYVKKIGSPDWWLLVFPLAVFLLLYFSAYWVSRKLEKEVHEKYHMVSYL